MALDRLFDNVHPNSADVRPYASSSALPADVFHSRDEHHLPLQLQALPQPTLRIAGDTS